MTKNIPKNILEFDSEMQEFEKDIAFLKDVFHKLQKIKQRREKLEKYYYEGDWLKDFEKYSDAMIGILSEDWLYNLFFEEQEARKEILKKLVEQL